MSQLIDFLSPDFTYEDQRGTLVQLVREGYKQVNVVTSKAGCYRGGHYHQLNWETFYVFSGKLALAARKRNETERHQFSTGDMFSIPPGVTHNFQFIEDTILIGLYDLGVELENGEKDIIPDELR